MHNPILPESTLRALHQKIQVSVEQRRPPYNVDWEDPDYGLAFIYHLFFSQNPSVCKVLGVELDEETKFYNRYYWFRRFVARHKQKHGYDAGLEDQASDILASGAQFDLDVEIIHMIDKKANEL